MASGAQRASDGEGERERDTNERGMDSERHARPTTAVTRTVSEGGRRGGERMSERARDGRIAGGRGGGGRLKRQL